MNNLHKVKLVTVLATVQEFRYIISLYNKTNSILIL